MTEHTHHPAANAPVQSHEPVHPQWLPEASAPYIAKAQELARQTLNLSERVSRLRDVIESLEKQVGV